MQSQSAHVETVMRKIGCTSVRLMRAKCFTVHSSSVHSQIECPIFPSFLCELASSIRQSLPFQKLLLLRNASSHFKANKWQKKVSKAAAFTRMMTKTASCCSLWKNARDLKKLFDLCRRRRNGFRKLIFRQETSKILFFQSCSFFHIPKGVVLV